MIYTLLDFLVGFGESWIAVSQLLFDFLVSDVSDYMQSFFVDLFGDNVLTWLLGSILNVIDFLFGADFEFIGFLAGGSIITYVIFLVVVVVVGWVDKINPL